jgi:hypothetical protein
MNYKKIKIQSLIVAKEKENKEWLQECQNLQEAGVWKYDDKIVYARNRLKWTGRELNSLKYKLSLLEKKND